jgi:hypothetical protein
LLGRPRCPSLDHTSAEFNDRVVDGKLRINCERLAIHVVIRFAEFGSQSLRLCFSPLLIEIVGMMFQRAKIDIRSRNGDGSYYTQSS